MLTPGWDNNGRAMHTKSAHPLERSLGDYYTFYTDPDVPWTNNSTEQVIGWMR